MAKDDYTNYAPGALRLKGAKVDKTKKKKKKPKPVDDDAVTKTAEQGADSAAAAADADKSADDAAGADDDGAVYEPQKTDAQRKHEALQLRREMERLERGGHIKSHKERVEDFNKKLAAQSEHHDMPKIGPG